MGPAKLPLSKPENFMKKQLKQLPEKKDFKYPNAENRKPDVPNHTEKPVMGMKSNKNFITVNAVDNIQSVPKKPASNFADTRDGATHPLEPSGLTPKYVNKKEYGKAPTYLVKRKEDMERAQQEYNEYIQESMRQGAMKTLSETERQNIVAGLKTNWDELQHQYQGLSVVTDTAPKKNRKERMEAEMDQLEKDIELLEKHSNIYIVSGNEYY